MATMTEWMAENRWLVLTGVVLLVLWMCRNKLEGFIPKWTASHQNGFSVYDEAMMKGGRVYQKLNDVEHGVCRGACKKRWGTEFKNCHAYNYKKGTGDCDLIEYDGSYGGGITPHAEGGSAGGYNYNNPYASHTLFES